MCPAYIAAAHFAVTLGALNRKGINVATRIRGAQTSIAPSYEHRRGARHPSLVPPSVLAALHEGAESVNFMEQIALDQGELLARHYPSLASRADIVRHPKLVTRMRLAADLLLGTRGSDWPTEAANHISDTVRGWGAMAVGLAPNLPLEERLEAVRLYADDHHFGVREWAWLGVRQHIVSEPERALKYLVSWTDDPSERIRRFASESTRPIGVWSPHLPLLKAEPWRGQPLLDALRHDGHSYVQDSVANWLNDASKSQPHWVSTTCRSWGTLQDPRVSPRLLRRAMRTILQRAR